MIYMDEQERWGGKSPDMGIVMVGPSNNATALRNKEHLPNPLWEHIWWDILTNSGSDLASLSID